MRNDHLERSAKTIRAKKRTHKRWMRVVSTLAAITVFCTTYALILPAITMSTTAYCGLEEHEHSEACYERQLVCGFDENGNAVTPQEGEAAEAAPATEIVTESVLVDAGHIHDESCYNVETTLICENTEEDHEHTEACYEEVQTLVCGEEEREAVYEEREVEVPVEAPDAQAAPAVEAPVSEGTHEHTDACYEEVLICEKEEHKHTDECFANSEADLETAEIWERTLPEKSAMKDEWKEDTLLVAQSQVGYKESEANYVVVNEEHKGYTRYGEMFGVPYGDWCAMFLQFSLHYAGVDTRAMVGSPSVPLWVEAEIENENFYKVGEKIKDEETGEEKEYEPKATDIIFFDWENDGSPDHVGIIEEIKMDANDETKIDSIITIEGNSQNEVRRNTYKADDKHIFGYAEIPDKMTEEELQALAEGKKPEEEKKEEAPKKEYVGVDGTLISTGDDYEITVSYTAEAGIPENASLNVVEILQDADEYSIYNDKAAEEVYGHAEVLPYARFFDITILDEEGLEIEPKSTVSVVIDTKDDVLNTEDVEFAAVHFVDESKKVQEEAAPAPVPEATESMAHAGTMEEVTAAIQDAEYIAATTTVVNPEAITTATMDITTDQVVAFDTDGFSVYGVVMYYTVDFYYVKRTETTPAGSYFDLIGQSVKDAIGANAGGEGEEAEAEAEDTAEEEAVESEEVVVEETVSDEAVASEETAVEGEVTTETEDTTGEENTVVEETSTPIEYTEYHMPGGTEMLMSDLFENLEIERNAADISSVEFTDEMLLAFFDAEDDYIIKSLKPFQTYEKLTITFNNGDVIVIDVTDVVEIKDSNTYRIYKVAPASPSMEELEKIISEASKLHKTNITIELDSVMYVDRSVTIPSGMTVTFKGILQPDSNGNKTVKPNLFRVKDAVIEGAFIEVEEGATLIVEDIQFNGMTQHKYWSNVLGGYWAYMPSASGITATNTPKPNERTWTGIFIGSEGNTTLNNCVFVGINANSNASGPLADPATIADYGLINAAPIYSSKGTLTINGGEIFANYLYENGENNSNGGAIIAKGQLNIDGTNIHDDIAGGGIIIADGATGNIKDALIDNNRVNGSDAAPVVAKNGADVTLDSTTISNNIAKYPHWNDYGDAVVDSDTFNTFWNELVNKDYADWANGGGLGTGTNVRYTDGMTGGYFYGYNGGADDASTGSAEGYIEKDPIKSAGAVLVNGATVTMSNGSTIKNNMGDHGAVLVRNGGVFNQEDDTYIQGNRGYHGVVAITENATYNMNGGLIGVDNSDPENIDQTQKNQTIWFGTVNVSSENAGFTMGTTGGNPKINGNVSMHKGGGVYVNSKNTNLYKGEITNNQALIFGGGIYLERYRNMVLDSAEITDNTAVVPSEFADRTDSWKQTLGIGYGGGFWSCPTGQTQFDTDYVSLYGNHLGNANSNRGTDFYIQDNADKLTFTTDKSWKVEYGTGPSPTTTPAENYKANPSSNNKIQLGLKLADGQSFSGSKRLIISGNSAATGGGVASNGYLDLMEKTTRTDFELGFKKEYDGDEWNDVRIQVVLWNGSQEVERSDWKYITSDDKDAIITFDLPSVVYRDRKKDTDDLAAYQQAQAYGRFYEIMPFKVGMNSPSGTTWKLEIIEEANTAAGYKPVADTAGDSPYTATVSNVSRTDNDNQNAQGVDYYKEYEAVSSIHNHGEEIVDILELTKVDADTLNPLKGATFNLWSFDGQLWNDKMEILDNGTRFSISAANLDKNKLYYLAEDGVPNGYKGLNRVIAFDFDSEGKFRIRTDITSHNHYSNGKFKTGSTAVTGASGHTYYETSSDSRYKRADSYTHVLPNGESDLNNAGVTCTRGNSSLIVTASNKAQDIKIKKVDSLTGNSLQATFQVYYDEVEGLHESLFGNNPDGTPKIGSWKYVNVFAKKTDNLSYGGEYLGWKNIKKDNYNALRRMGSIDDTGFAVDSNGRMVDGEKQLLRYMLHKDLYEEGDFKDNYISYTTDATTGEVSIGALPAGTYTIIETVAPSGYNLPEATADRSITITVDANGNITSAVGATNGINATPIVANENNVATVTIKNKGARYPIYIKKVDQNGNTLSGANFKVRPVPQGTDYAGKLFVDTTINDQIGYYVYNNEDTVNGKPYVQTGKVYSIWENTAPTLAGVQYQKLNNNNGIDIPFMLDEDGTPHLITKDDPVYNYSKLPANADLWADGNGLEGWKTVWESILSNNQVSIATETVDGEQVFAIKIENNEPSTSVEPAYLDLKAKKQIIDPVTGSVIEGLIEEDQYKSAFSFTITGSSGAPMPSSHTVHNNGEEINFGRIAFNQAGTFTYVIREVAGEEQGVDYDSTERTITVVVDEINYYGDTKYVISSISPDDSVEYVNSTDTYSPGTNVTVKSFLHNVYYNEGNGIDYKLFTLENGAAGTPWISIDGRSAYCLDSSKTIPTNHSYSETTFNNNINLIKKALYVGYPYDSDSGVITKYIMEELSGKPVNYSTKTASQLYRIATQLVIWRIMNGETLPTTGPVDGTTDALKVVDLICQKISNVDDSLLSDINLHVFSRSSGYGTSTYQRVVLASIPRRIPVVTVSNSFKNSISGELSVNKTVVDYKHNPMSVTDSFDTSFVLHVTLAKPNGSGFNGNTNNPEIYYVVKDPSGQIIKSNSTPIKDADGNTIRSSNDSNSRHALLNSTTGTRKLKVNNTASGFTITLKDYETIVFKNLPIGSTWTISEDTTGMTTYTLEGYVKDGEPEIEGTSISGTVSGSNNVDVHNERTMPELQIKKVDAANNEQVLKGAEFVLLLSEDYDMRGWKYVNIFATHDPKESGNGNGPDTFLNNDKFVYNHLNGINNGQYRTFNKGLLVNKSDNSIIRDDKGYLVRYMTNTLVTGENEQSGISVPFVTDENGLVNLGPLPDGKYRLVETKAPAGYNKLAEEIIVTVSNNGTTISTSNGQSVSPDTATNIAQIVIQNTSGVSLPNTGGIGTVIFTALGAVLVVGAAIALLATRKRRD